MYIIEPCCASRQLMLLRDKIGKDGTMDFEGYGDLSLTELLPAILTRYSETELAIAAPSLPDQAAEVIIVWMNQQWSRQDGRGKLNAIRHLTVIADEGIGLGHGRIAHVDDPRLRLRAGDAQQH